jgi:hypothetical protein
MLRIATFVEQPLLGWQLPVRPRLKSAHYWAHLIESKVDIERALLAPRSCVGGKCHSEIGRNENKIVQLNAQLTRHDFGAKAIL